MDNGNEHEILTKKADAYCILKERVHIKFKKGNWKRGIIQEVKADFFMLDETMEGLQPVFFLEIESIEKYTPKKEGNKDGRN